MGGLAASVAGLGAPTNAQQESGSAAVRWALQEFNPSTLNLREQLEEMAFFAKAAQPLRHERIFVLSEDTPTHRYESRVLARAFFEITGIAVIHDVVRESEVVNRLQQQRRTGRNLYDAYVNDSDFIGTHFRYGGVVALSDWMTGDGASVTLPTLDLDDFIGTDFCTAPDGKLYQLPDQQFASLYWFRHDWFERPALRDAFAARYGYALGVPLNWRAYEDIADFFTNHVREIDGHRVWGHMDYGARDPSLGWRFTDAWLAVAGAGDVGWSDGAPVRDWGIRTENCVAVGASVARGGATNAPAAVYALRKYLEWLDAYAPPEARRMTFDEAGAAVGSGAVAQQISWYTAFIPDLVQPGSPVANSDGSAKWRVAPTPVGAYWRPGMKRGYQDCGAWTFMESTPPDRLKAAWLYAQFCVSKSVSLKKTLVGFAPIRESDLRSDALTAAAPRLGGLVEFYRSPLRDLFSPTGASIPDYAVLQQLWWQAVSAAVSGRLDAREAMDALAYEIDTTLARLSNTGNMLRCAPLIGEAEAPEAWLARPGAPAPAIPDEEGRAKTLAYEALIGNWQLQKDP
jgi:glycerol transport system substrate-binding protein